MVDAVPMLSKAQIMAPVAGDSWLEKGDNLLVFGPPGGEVALSAAAIGVGLIENGWRALFARTTDLVQKLRIARREPRSLLLNASMKPLSVGLPGREKSKVTSLA